MGATAGAISKPVSGSPGPPARAAGAAASARTTARRKPGPPRKRILDRIRDAAGNAIGAGAMEYLSDTGRAFLPAPRCSGHGCIAISI